MNSKWAEGIKPRGFRWVIKDRFAVCERPGGYGAAHRSVRRAEEIIWLCRNDIGLVISLTAMPYNLHAYETQELPYVHLPLTDPFENPGSYKVVLETIRDSSATQRVVLHHDAIGDVVAGVVAGYLLWTGLVEGAPRTIAVTESLLEREMGPPAREMVNIADRLRC